MKCPAVKVVRGLRFPCRWQGREVAWRRHTLHRWGEPLADGGWLEVTWRTEPPPGLLPAGICRPGLHRWEGGTCTRCGMGSRKGVPEEA